MQQGISDFEIERVFNELNNEDLDDNFLGVHPSNKINKFIALNRMMKGRQYHFLIANTDRSDKGGTHWWSIFDINPVSDFILTGTFGNERLRKFIIQDDKKIVEKVIKGTEKMD